MKRLKYLYHATSTENTKGILKHGLIPDFKPASITGGRKIVGVIELDSELSGLRKWLEKHGYIKNDWTILKVDINYLDRSKLDRSRFYLIRGGGKRENSTWYTYKGVIPPEAINIKALAPH